MRCTLLVLLLTAACALLLAAPVGAQAKSPDFDGDGKVDFEDFFLFAAAFGGSDARFDLNGSGRVGLEDFLLFAADFGRMEEKPTALPGLPADVAGYERWLKLNAQPIPPRTADPHNGTKNVYVNQGRVVIAPDGQQRFPYPEGSIVVKEATRPGKDFIGLIAIMRKVRGSDPKHNDWTFIEYTRSDKDAPFREAAKGGVCWGCHAVAEDTDHVFTALQ